MTRKMLSAMVLAASLAALAGCDGSIGFRDAAGVVEHASGKVLVRGLADSMQLVGEEPEKTTARRDAVEAAAKRSGFDLSSELGDLLKGNKNYQNVVFNKLVEGPFELPAYPVRVEFDIEGGHHAQINFIVQQKTMLGILHATKLPIFDSASVKHGEEVLLIPGKDVFALVLAGDREALKARADKVWGVVQARQEAASAAERQALCEKRQQVQAESFAVDPALGEAEKQAALAQQQAALEAAMKECLAH